MDGGKRGAGIVGSNGLLPSSKKGACSCHPSQGRSSDT